MAFADIFRQITGISWDPVYQPFYDIAEIRYREDSHGVPEDVNVHDVAVSYYIMHLITSDESGIGAKLSESLGDYSFSRAASKYDHMGGWLAKYTAFLAEFKNGLFSGVPLPPPDPMLGFDRWEGGCL